MFKIVARNGSFHRSNCVASLAVARAGSPTMKEGSPKSPSVNDCSAPNHNLILVRGGRWIFPKALLVYDVKTTKSIKSLYFLL